MSVDDRRLGLGVPLALAHRHAPLDARDQDLAGIAARRSAGSAATPDPCMPSQKSIDTGAGSSSPLMPRMRLPSGIEEGRCAVVRRAQPVEAVLVEGVVDDGGLGLLAIAEPRVVVSGRRPPTGRWRRVHAGAALPESDEQRSGQQDDQADPKTMTLLRPFMMLPSSTSNTGDPSGARAHPIEPCGAPPSLLGSPPRRTHRRALEDHRLATLPHPADVVSPGRPSPPRR